MTAGMDTAEVAAAVAESLEALFLDGDFTAETDTDPHTLKGGSFCPSGEAQTVPNALVLLTNDRKVRAGLRVISGQNDDTKGGKTAPPPQTPGEGVRGRCGGPL